MKLDKDTIINNARESLNSIKVFAKNTMQKISTAINGEKEKDNAEEQSDKTQAETIETQEQSSAGASFDATEIKAAAEGVQKQKYAGLTIALAILDIIASLVFVAAIVIAIKPSLLTDAPFDQLYKYTSFAEKIGDTLIKVEAIQDKIPINTKILQACATGLGLIIFGLLKIVVLLAAKSGSKKIVSALTLAMTYLACFMMSDKFLLFSIFILLLYFTFSYSCGFSTPAVLVKFGVVVVSTIVIYVAVHFAIDPSLPEAAQKIFTALRLPILRW